MLLIKSTNVRLRTDLRYNFFVLKFEKNKHEISIVSEVQKNRRVRTKNILLSQP